MATFESNHNLSIDLSPSDRHKASLPWDKFQQWLHCVCVVTFDLELGQALEVSDNRGLLKFSANSVFFLLYFSPNFYRRHTQR